MTHSANANVHQEGAGRPPSSLLAPNTGTSGSVRLSGGSFLVFEVATERARYCPCLVKLLPCPVTRLVNNIFANGVAEPGNSSVSLSPSSRLIFSLSPLPHRGFCGNSMSYFSLNREVVFFRYTSYLHLPTTSRGRFHSSHFGGMKRPALRLQEVN